MLSIAAYTGASVLFGAFLAGTLLNSLPRRISIDTEPEVLQGAELSTAPGLNLFVEVFREYVQDVQEYIFQPLFFASIGFAIPFLDMWTGRAVWRGIVFSLLMMLAKVIVGLVIPARTMLGLQFSKSEPGARSPRQTLAPTLFPAALLGLAMIARGEIGLLIIQIGRNETKYLSEDAFIIAIWAILLNTIVGPPAVGFLLKSRAMTIAEGPWGIVEKQRSG